jgi:hypothetical protein
MLASAIRLRLFHGAFFFLFVLRPGRRPLAARPMFKLQQKKTEEKKPGFRTRLKLQLQPPV